MNTLEALENAAKAKACEVVTITRADGSTFQGARGYATADNGVVQAYVISCSRRISTMRDHFRVMFYANNGVGWKRISKAAAEALLLQEVK